MMTLLNEKTPRFLCSPSCPKTLKKKDTVLILWLLAKLDKGVGLGEENPLLGRVPCSGAMEAPEPLAPHPVCVLPQHGLERRRVRPHPVRLAHVANDGLVPLALDAARGLVVEHAE